MSEKVHAFLKGIPTKIDVDQLDAKWPKVNEGDVIRLQDLAGHLRLDVQSFRFKGVLMAWRKKIEREHNLLSVGTGDGAIRFADPAERVAYAARKVKSGRKAMIRGIVVANGTDAGRLTDEQRKARQSLLDMNATRAKLAGAVMA